AADDQRLALALGGAVAQLVDGGQVVLDGAAADGELALPLVVALGVERRQLVGAPARLIAVVTLRLQDAGLVGDLGADGDLASLVCGADVGDGGRARVLGARGGGGEGEQGGNDEALGRFHGGENTSGCVPIKRRRARPPG